MSALSIPAPAHSREEWQAKIASAEGCAHIFELANQALASREVWGDDLRASQAAARKWAGFFFPVEAIESGAVLPGAVMARSDLLALGQEAAKAVAIALLEPMPARASDGALKTEEVLGAQWNYASAQAEGAALKALRRAPGGAQIQPQHLFGFESVSVNAKIEWEEAGHVRSWSEVADKLSKPWEKCIKADCSPSGQEALAAQWDNASGEVGQLAGLLADSGASFVLAGPAGGISAICKGASVLRESYRDLARLSGLTTEAVGMGLEGIGLNMAGRGHIAYQNTPLNLMAFGHVPTGVGHEWTHQVDARVSAVGTPKQRQALEALRMAPMVVEPDPELVAKRRGAMLDAQRVNLGYFLVEKCRDDLARAHLVAGADSTEEPSCDAAFMELAREAIVGGKEEWFSFWLKCLDPKKTGPSTADLWRVGAALKEAFGVDGRTDNICDFLREAQAQDARHYAMKGYFSSAEEMIARISESTFIGQGAVPSLACERKKDSETIPMGSEAESFSKYYAALMDACAAEPDALMGARAKAAKSRGAESVPEPLAASLNFDAWRSQREERVEPSGQGPKRDAVL